MTTELRNILAVRHPSTVFLFVIVNKIQVLRNTCKTLVLSLKKDVCGLKTARKQGTASSWLFCLTVQGSQTGFICSEQQDRDPVLPLVSPPLQRTPNPSEESLPLG